MRLSKNLGMNIQIYLYWGNDMNTNTNNIWGPFYLNVRIFKYLWSSLSWYIDWVFKFQLSLIVIPIQNQECHLRFPPGSWWCILPPSFPGATGVRKPLALPENTTHWALYYRLAIYREVTFVTPAAENTDTVFHKLNVNIWVFVHKK